MRERAAMCSVCRRFDVWTVELVCQRPSCQELAARAASRRFARRDGEDAPRPVSSPSSQPGVVAGPVLAPSSTGPTYSGGET